MGTDIAESRSAALDLYCLLLSAQLLDYALVGFNRGKESVYVCSSLRIRF